MPDVEARSDSATLDHLGIAAQNGNTNRLLRQYLPDGTDFSMHSQVQLSAIAG